MPNQIHTLLRGGRAGDAHRLAIEKLHANPNNPDLRCALAETFLALGRVADALSQLELVRRTHPNHRPAYLLLERMSGNRSTDAPPTADFDAADVQHELRQRSIPSGATSLDETHTLPGNYAVEEYSEILTVDADIVEEEEEEEEEHSTLRRFDPPHGLNRYQNAHDNDDTFGVFNELSQDYIQQIEEEHLNARKDQDQHSVDDYLAQFISETPSSEITADAPSVAHHGDRPVAHDPGHVQYEARPTELFEGGRSSGPPTAGTSVQTPSRLGAGRATDIDPNFASGFVPQPATPGPNNPIVVVDTGANELDSTQTFDDANHEIEKAKKEAKRLNKGGGLLRKGRPAEKPRAQMPNIATHSAEPAVRPLPEPAHVPDRAVAASGVSAVVSAIGARWNRVFVRSLAFGFLFSLVFGATYLPLVWQASLKSRMVHEMSTGLQALDQGTLEGARSASDAFDSAAKMSGSRSEFLDAIATSYLTLVGFEEVGPLRQAAGELSALSEAYGQRLAGGKGVDESLSAESRTSPIQTALVGPNMDAKGSEFAVFAEAGIPIWRGFSVFQLSPQEGGLANPTVTHAERSEIGSSDLARLGVALSVAATSPDRALSTLDDLASKGMPIAVIRRAEVLIARGDAPTAQLEGLLRNDGPPLSDSEKARAHSLLAEIAIREQRLGDAEQHLVIATKLVPDDGELAAQLVNLFIRERRTSSAETTLRAAIARTPDDPNLRVAQANLLVLSGATRDAVKLLDTKQGVHGGSQFALGRIALSHQNFAVAKLHFDKAVGASRGAQRTLSEHFAKLTSPNVEEHQLGWTSMAPKLGVQSPEVKLMVAWSLLQHSVHRDVAEAIFGDFVKNDPNSPQGLAGLCALAGQERSRPTALSTCASALSADGESTSTLAAAGIAYSLVERHGDAIPLLERVRLIYPSQSVYESLMTSQFATFKLGEVPTQLDEWLTGVGSSPVQYYWNARLQMVSGEFDQARSLLESALREAGDIPAWNLRLAETLFHLGRVTAAKELANKLTDTKGVRIDAKTLLSTIALSERKQEDARRLAKEALEHHKKDGGTKAQKAGALVALGRVLQDLGRPNYGSAKSKFIQATRADPFSVDAFYALGQIERLLGRIEDAKKAFDGALTIYPEHQPSRSALRSL